MILTLVLALAAADWYAVARSNKTLEYIFKPATMVGVIALTLSLTLEPHDVWQTRWFLAGFVFSLAGDVFLMLPNPRLFVFGLGAFLAGHVCFIIGLNPTLPPTNAFALLLPVALVAGVVVWRIIQSLRAGNQTSLIGPVIAYGVAMTLMVFSAWATLFRPEWVGARVVFVIAGATLFFISDGVLAWNRFVRPFAAAKLAVIVTYHVAQVLLALSVASGG